MKLVVQVKLLPTPEQASALEATLRACNAAATEVAAMAREIGERWGAVNRPHAASPRSQRGK